MAFDGAVADGAVFAAVPCGVEGGLGNMWAEDSTWAISMTWPSPVRRRWRSAAITATAPCMPPQ
ncbi:hypothetical protein O0235_02335 [Tepidiforma flava]|uniref:Uncharacterized protein n=1 Tax=Tepidiforma flava TaxID=3004094 RepID=A0ABY7M7C6_9CHLR|nr:hypothetical protein [Tepidiforma flava]WBL36427.1 hypothetical protein O0235_02335 [Tepidiforma flava]